MSASVTERALRRDEALLGRLDGLRADEMRLLDRFIRSGNRTMDLPLSDYAADSLHRKSLIEYAGRPRPGDDQTYSIPETVWNAWAQTLARRR